MAFNPDHLGWYEQSDAELARARAERAADATRAEVLYVSDEYKVFFLTRQPDAAAGTGRQAYISVKPFNTMPPETVKSLRTQAEVWTPASGVRITVGEPTVVFHDDITKTQTPLYIGEFDPDVRQRLRGGAETESAWTRRFNAAAAASGAEIQVHKPLMLKHTASSAVP